jgi:hypothetical protein
MRKLIFCPAFLFFLCALTAIGQWVDAPKKEVLYSGAVFVSPGETTFHKESCKLLPAGRTGMRLEYAIKRGYKPCPVCFPEAYPPQFEWSFSLTAPDGSNGLQFSDALVDMIFIITRTQVGFAAQNKSKTAIKVNWDDIAYVAVSGVAGRVIHSGIRLVDKEKSQAATVIPPGAKITDAIIPADNVTYAGGWKEARLFDGDYMSYNGKEFGLYFPVEINGTKKEYSFRFKIGVSQLTGSDK